MLHRVMQIAVVAISIAGTKGLCGVCKPLLVLINFTDMFYKNFPIFYELSDLLYTIII